MASLKLLASRIVDGRWNLSVNSCDHCLRRLAGRMISSLRRRSAQSWDSRRPASMVLPNPTSSARITPLEKGLRRAKRAASTWCGFRSTWASESADDNRPVSSSADRRVRSWAKSLAWYGENTNLIHLIYYITLWQLLPKWPLFNAKLCEIFRPRFNFTFNKFSAIQRESFS